MIIRPEHSPLISATGLGTRWGKRGPALARMERDGVIAPVARAGHQKSYAMADVLRVEAGLMPKQRALRDLSETQRASLPGILTLLGLTGAELTAEECLSLLAVFHSVPYDCRGDEATLIAHLELGNMLLHAVSRAETFAAIKAAPALQAAVRDLQLVVNRLADQGGCNVNSL